MPANSTPTLKTGRTAAVAIPANSPVTPDNLVATRGQTIIGFSQQSVPAGGRMTVVVDGSAEAWAGEAIADGALLQVGDNGTVVAQTGSGVIIGRALNAAALGDKVEVLLAGPAAQAPVSGGGNVLGVLIDGDSLGAQNWNELSAGLTITRSGTTASVTATSYAPQIGSRLRIGNVTSDPRWNGFWPVTGLSGSTATFTVDASFDPAPTTTRSQISISPDTQRTACGDYVWAEMVNGVNYTLIDNVAIGGRVMTEILADFYAVGPGLYRNCLIDLVGPTNDPKNSVATATSSLAYEQYIQAAIACGHKVLCQTVAPLFGAQNTATTQQLTLALNNEIRRLALKYKMPLFDKYAALVDPATAALLAANADGDQIHLTPAAARICGAAKAPIYARYVTTRPFALPATISDTSGVISTSSNIFDGFFAGTSGSGGAGSVATGWVLAPTTITVTGSKGAGAVGATQILTLSGASGFFTLSGTSVHAQVVAGGTYEFVGKVSWANFAAGLRVTIEVLNTINGQAGSVRPLGTRNSSTPLPTGSGSLLFRTEPIVIPAGASITNFAPRFTGVTTGTPGGTETVTLENFAIRRIA